MTLQFALFASPSEAMLADYSSRVQGLICSTNEHGFQELSCFLPCSREEAFWLYDRPGLPHVILDAGPHRVWEGRLEDVAIVSGGVRLGAFGYWRAFSDMTFTPSLFSSTDMRLWRTSLESDVSNRTPKRYTMDTQNRLFIGLTKNSTYASGADVAGLTTETPDDTNRAFTAISFDYEVLMPTNWTIAMTRRDRDFLVPTTLWSIAGSGALQTGSQTLTFTGQHRLELMVFNNTGASVTYTGESGANYAKLTNVRVKTLTSSTLTADTVASALVTFVTLLNPTQIVDDAALIQSPGLDLRDELYEEQLPADILTRLAALGDTSARMWEAGVWEGRRLHLRPRGSAGREWYVDAAELEVERSLDRLINSVYATYQEAGGRPLRTAIGQNAASVSRYGVIRRRSIRASTTDETQAITHRDTALADGKEPMPRAALSFRALYGVDGARYPLYLARSGDTLTIRNLPPTLSTAIDRIRTFRIARTTYRAERDVLEVEPESPLPRLETLLARRAEGL